MHGGGGRVTRDAIPLLVAQALAQDKAQTEQDSGAVMKHGRPIGGREDSWAMCDGVKRMVECGRDCQGLTRLKCAARKPCRRRQAIK